MGLDVSTKPGAIQFNVATDRIEVIVGEPNELLRWEPINRLTMLQHLPPLVVERLWDMFSDAAGPGFYAEDRLAGVKSVAYTGSQGILRRRKASGSTKSRCLSSQHGHPL